VCQKSYEKPPELMFEGLFNIPGRNVLIDKKITPIFFQAKA
jgi:hypothetical protein